MKLETEFIFLIKDRETVLHFLEILPSTYKVLIPLPKIYYECNYTDLSELPSDPKEVTAVNLTLPISSPRELTIATRVLKEYYFFYSIPQEWINIPTKESNTNTRDLSPTLTNYKLL